jgi:hypothetical protein
LRRRTSLWVRSAFRRRAIIKDSQQQGARLGGCIGAANRDPPLLFNLEVPWWKAKDARNGQHHMPFFDQGTGCLSPIILRTRLTYQLSDFDQPFQLSVYLTKLICGIFGS